MDNKYKQPEENNEKDQLNEPAITYGNTFPITEMEKIISMTPNPPCVFTDEEKVQRINQAIKDEEAGNFFTHEEIVNKYKNKL